MSHYLSLFIISNNGQNLNRTVNKTNVSCHSHMCGVCTYAAEIVYRYVATLRGETVTLWCNTSQSGGVVSWRQRPTNGNDTFVYVNGRIDGRPGTEGRYSIVSSSRNERSLRIYNVHPRLDTGRYECYEDDVRRVGYHLNVTGALYHCLLYKSQ